MEASWCKDLEQGRPHSQPTNQPTSPPNQPNQPIYKLPNQPLCNRCPASGCSSSKRLQAQRCFVDSGRRQLDPMILRSPPEMGSASKRVDADVPFPPGRNSRDPIVVRSVAPHVFLLLLQCLVQTFYFLSFSFLLSHLVYCFRLFDPGSSHILWYLKSAIHEIIRKYREYSPFSGLYVTMK